MSDPIELQPGQDQLITHAKGGLKLSYNRERTRVRVTAPGVLVPPPVEPPPVPPPGFPPGLVIAPGANIATLLRDGTRQFVNHGGSYTFALGSSLSPYKDVAFNQYPNEHPVLDGAGARNAFYLGPQSGRWWVDLEMRGYRPSGNGAIGVGNGCRFESGPNFKLVGPGGAASNQDHGVYFFGTGTGLLLQPDIRDFPGSAVQLYLPGGVNRDDYPVVEIRGGYLHGKTFACYAYSGHLILNGVTLLGGNFEVDWQRPGRLTVINCKRPDGSPIRVNGPHD